MDDSAWQACTFRAPAEASSAHMHVAMMGKVGNARHGIGDSICNHRDSTCPGVVDNLDLVCDVNPLPLYNPSPFLLYSSSIRVPSPRCSSST